MKITIVAILIAAFTAFVPAYAAEPEIEIGDEIVVPSNTFRCHDKSEMHQMIRAALTGKGEIIRDTFVFSSSCKRALTGDDGFVEAITQNGLLSCILFSREKTCSWMVRGTFSKK